MLGRTLTSLVLALSAVFASTLPAWAANDVWELHSPASGTNVDSYLFRATSLAANNVWAVGTVVDFNGNRTLAENWNGSTWTENSPPASYNSELFGVTALNASNVYAVGYTNTAAVAGTYAFNTQPTTASGYTLIEKYNGSAWVQQTSPSPGSGFNQLRSVCFNSSTDGWAVGSYYDGTSGPYKTLALHWDGTAWNQKTTPIPTGSTNNYLYGVACVDSTHVKAVGNSDTHTLILNYNGTSWSQDPSPNPGLGQNFLEDVACLTSINCRAAGEYQATSGSHYSTLILRWDGTSWSSEPTPNPSNGGDNTLSGVAYYSSTWIWAVGSYNKSGVDQTLVIKGNGSTWSQVSSPNQGAGANHLVGVTLQPGAGGCTTNDSWAVGWYHNTTYNNDEMLAERYIKSAPCR